MLNNSFNEQQEKISFEILIKNLFEEYSQISLNDLKELFQIFENLHFHSLISSYDFILKQHYQSTSNIQFHLSDDDDEEENSFKPDDVSSKKNKKKDQSLFILFVSILIKMNKYQCRNYLMKKIMHQNYLNIMLVD
jgi:hypothetical protein